MSDDRSSPSEIDRNRVLNSMRPALWLGYEQFAIAACVFGALCLLGVARLALGEDPDARWYAGMPALVLGSSLFVLLVGAALGYTLRRRRLRHERLDQHGVRHAVERTRCESIVWATGKSSTTWRWIAVATWRDAGGQEHDAVAGPFDYDPTPLLDAKRLAVLADRADAAISRIEPDALPSLHHSRLSPQQRTLVPMPISHAMRIFIAIVLLLMFLISGFWIALPLFDVP